MSKTVQVDVGHFVSQISKDLDEITGLIKTLDDKVSVYNRKYRTKMRLEVDARIIDLNYNVCEANADILDKLEAIKEPNINKC